MTGLVLTLLAIAELVAFAGWGRIAYVAAGDDGTVAAWAAAVIAVIVVTLVWGLVASPQARFRHPVGTPAVTVIVFAGAVIGLLAVGPRDLGLALALVAAPCLLYVARVRPSRSPSRRGSPPSDW